MHERQHGAICENRAAVRFEDLTKTLLREESQIQSVFWMSSEALVGAMQRCRVVVGNDQVTCGDSHDLCGELRPTVRVAHVVEEAEVEHQIECVVFERERGVEVDARNRKGRTRTRFIGSELAQAFCIAISTHELLSGGVAELGGETAEPTGEIENALARPNEREEGLHEALLAVVDEGL